MFRNVRKIRQSSHAKVSQRSHFLDKYRNTAISGALAKDSQSQVSTVRPRCVQKTVLPVVSAPFAITQPE